MSRKENNNAAAAANGQDEQGTGAEAPVPHIRRRPPPPGFAAAAEGKPSDSRASASAGDGSYETGYCKPPVGTRFRKGQSGNPKGRPKGAKSLGTIIREQMTAKVQVRTGQGTRRVNRAEALTMKWVEMASRGDSRAIERMLRLYAEHGPAEPIPDDGATSAAPLSEADAALLAQLRDDISKELRGAYSGTIEDEANDRGENDDDR